MCYENATFSLLLYTADVVIRELYPSVNANARWQWVRANLDGLIIQRYEQVATFLGIPQAIITPFAQLIRTTGDGFFNLPHFACIRDKLEQVVRDDIPTTAPFRLHQH